VRDHLESSLVPRLLVKMMRGLGDTIYQRPFIRVLAHGHNLYLRTPWPELFSDVPRVRFVGYTERLRTQAKNMRRNRRLYYWPQPHSIPTVKARYGISNPYRGIIPDFEAVFGVAFNPNFFDLPNLGQCPIQADKPIAVVRPVTVRNEWANPARNCKPEYITEAIRILRERFYVVTVADVVENGEWFDGTAPEADASFHRGELHVSQLLSLVRHAAVVVGSVGWIAPAAVALKRPLVLIAGGQGAWNAPEIIYDSRLDTSRVRWIMPDRYCRCAPADHDCDKTISNFGDQFQRAIHDLN
jgi:hypothetical protein